MQYWLNVTGQTGKALLNSILPIVMADGFIDAQGHIIPCLHILITDTESLSDENLSALADYDQVLKAYAEETAGHPGFHTQLFLHQWILNENELPANEGSAEWLSILLGDLHSSQAAASVQMAYTLQESTQLPEWFEQLLSACRHGEEIRFITLADLYTPIGLASVLQITQGIRARIPDHHQLQLGTVCLGPYSMDESTESDANQAAKQYEEMRTAIRLLTENNLLNDKKPAPLDFFSIVGTHPGDRCTLHRVGQAALPEFMSIVAAADFLRTPLSDHTECRYFSVDPEQSAWSVLGPYASGYRMRIAGFLRCAFLFEIEILPQIHAYLNSTARLLNRFPRYCNAWFGKQQENTVLAQAAMEIMPAISRCFTRFTVWCMDWMNALPPSLTHRRALPDEFAAAAAHYRMLLNEAGQLALMEEEITKSGMDQENFVKRSNRTETDAERLIRETAERREHLSVIQEEQIAYFQRIGGRAAFAVIHQMLEGIRFAKQIDQDRLNHLPASAGSDAIYRLETHLRILEVQESYLMKDRIRFIDLHADLWESALPQDDEREWPFLSQPVLAAWIRHEREWPFLSQPVLAAWIRHRSLQPSTREQAQSSAQLLKLYPELIPGIDPNTILPAAAILKALGADKTSGGLLGLLAQLLFMTMKGV